MSNRPKGVKRRLNCKVPRACPWVSTTWPDVAKNILEALGAALIVSGVLAGTVDFYFRNRRNEEEKILRDRINENVFMAVLKQSFPEAIFEQVQSHLLTNPFIRKNYKITCSMEWEDSDRKRLITRDTTEYEVERIALRECTYELVSNIDFESAFPSRYISLEIQRPEDNEVIDKYDEQRMTDEGILSCDQSCHLIWLRVPINLRQHNKVRVKFTTEIYYKPDDFMIWMMTYMTECLSVRYITPSDVDVQFQPNHPSRNLFTTFDDGILHEYGYKGGFLPFQGITVTWQIREQLKEGKPNKSPTANSTAEGKVLLK